MARASSKYVVRRRNVYRVPAGNPERKRQLGRCRCRWENNTNMDHREIDRLFMDWIYLAQDRDQ
jgi:hypothetical protein